MIYFFFYMLFACVTPFSCDHVFAYVAFRPIFFIQSSKISPDFGTFYLLGHGWLSVHTKYGCWMHVVLRPRNGGKVRKESANQVRNAWLYEAIRHDFVYFLRNVRESLILTNHSKRAGAYFPGMAHLPCIPSAWEEIGHWAFSPLSS